MKYLVFLLCISLSIIAMNTSSSHEQAYPHVYNEKTRNTKHTFFQCSACSYNHDKRKYVEMHINKMRVGNKTYPTRQALAKLNITLEEFQNSNLD